MTTPISIQDTTMSNFQCVGANFDGPNLQGFQSSVSGSGSSPFAVSMNSTSPVVSETHSMQETSGASSQTSISLTSNVCLPPVSTHDTTRSQHHMGHLGKFVTDLRLVTLPFLRRRALGTNVCSQLKEPFRTLHIRDISRSKYS